MLDIKQIYKTFNASTPNEVRALNFYREGQETPYGQPVEQNLLPRVWAEVKRDAGIERRREYGRTTPVAVPSRGDHGGEHKN